MRKNEWILFLTFSIKSVLNYFLCYNTIINDILTGILFLLISS